jgi:kynurenine formamidase
MKMDRAFRTCQWIRFFSIVLFCLILQKLMSSLFSLQILSDTAINRKSRSAYDPQGYSERGPGISSDACRYLMDNFPSLKGIALDWLSLSSYAHMEEGVLAHQYLLGKFHSHQMVIIEDLNFSELDGQKLQRVIALPLLVRGIDSGPCQVVVEYEP